MLKIIKTIIKLICLPLFPFIVLFDQVVWNMMIAPALELSDDNPYKRISIKISINDAWKTWKKM